MLRVKLLEEDPRLIDVVKGEMKSVSVVREKYLAGCKGAINSEFRKNKNMEKEAWNQPALPLDPVQQRRPAGGCYVECPSVANEQS